jgi:hypothetical protein
MSDDRKYRQRGYQDDDRKGSKPSGPKPGPPGPRERPEGPKTPNLMPTHEVFRCARCGHLEDANIGSMSVCGKCGVPLHACVHCVSFDTSATFECQQEIPKRVSPKDERNECALFAPRTRVERETGSTAAASGPSSARKAFDDLFK